MKKLLLIITTIYLPNFALQYCDLSHYCRQKELDRIDTYYECRKEKFSKECCEKSGEGARMYGTDNSCYFLQDESGKKARENFRNCIMSQKDIECCKKADGEWRVIS